MAHLENGNDLFLLYKIQLEGLFINYVTPKGRYGIGLTMTRCDIGEEDRDIGL